MKAILKIFIIFSLFFSTTYWSFYNVNEILPSSYNTTTEIVLIKNKTIYIKEIVYNYINDSKIYNFYKYNPNTYKLTKILVYNPQTKKILYSKIKKYIK